MFKFRRLVSNFHLNAFLFNRVQLDEEQLELWHEEDDGASNRVPHGVKDFSKQGADEAVSKASDEREDRKKRNEGEEASMEEVVDLEKHLLACRSSLVHRKQRPISQLSTSQLSSPTPLGLRAHITLGCTEGVRPMQTGLDQVSS